MNVCMYTLCPSRRVVRMACGDSSRTRRLGITHMRACVHPRGRSGCPHHRFSRGLGCVDGRVGQGRAGQGDEEDRQADSLSNFVRASPVNAHPDHCVTRGRGKEKKEKRSIFPGPRNSVHANRTRGFACRPSSWFGFDIEAYLEPFVQFTISLQLCRRR